MTARLPKYSISLLALTSVFFLLVFIDNYYPVGKILAKTELSMGTIVEIKVPCGKKYDEPIISAIIDEALSEVKRVEGLFSVYRDDSEVSKINRLRQGESLELSSEVFDLIDKAVVYSKISNGAFDITVKPLVDLWKDASLNKRMPTRDEIEKAKSRVGWQRIKLDIIKKTISFDNEGMSIDLGGIAKGYATDRAAAILKARGVKNAIVNCGGDMYCLGRRSKRVMWNVGVQHPRDSRKAIFKIRLEDRAIDTSGDYEKYFILDGKRYSHIIDPRTGYPIGDSVVSATVIATDSTTADILATALCVLGDEWLDITRSIVGIDAIIISKSEGALDIKMTSDLIKRYDISETKIK